MKGEIKYPFAFDESNTLVSVNDVDIEHRHDHFYVCPQCGQSMLPRLGAKRTKHFYHSDNQSCGVESYIHKIAKLILEQRFNKREIPFLVKYSGTICCERELTCRHFRQTTCSSQEAKEIDLLKEYDLPAEVEPIVPGIKDTFKPDVCLRSSNPLNKQIFIEVWYKHKSSEKKIQSGFPIIEFHILTEADLLALATQQSFSEGEDIHFYNFKQIVPQQVLKERFAPCVFLNVEDRSSNTWQEQPNEHTAGKCSTDSANSKSDEEEEPSRPKFCHECQYYGTWYDKAEFCRKDLDISSRKGTFNDSLAEDCEMYHFDYRTHQ